MKSSKYTATTPLPLEAKKRICELIHNSLLDCILFVKFRMFPQIIWYWNIQYQIILSKLITKTVPRVRYYGITWQEHTSFAKRDEPL